MANINAEPANIDLVSLQTKRYSTFLDEKATAPPRAENGARANEAARGSAPSAESGIRDEKREEIKNGFTDRLTGILGKLIDKQAEMGGDFDGLFQPASKQPIKRLFDNLTADAGSGRAIDADKLAAFMADDRGLAAVYEVLQLESSDLKTASEGIEMPGGRVRWLEAVYGVDPKLFKKVRGKDGMLQVPEKNRAAIGDKARLGELDGFLDKFRDANGIPVKEDFALRLLRSLNSGGPIYLGFNDSGYEKKVFEELSSRNLAKNINGFELVNTYQEVQAKLLAGEVNGIFKDIIKNKRSDELATLFARRREELRTGPEGKWVIEGLEEQKADIQRGIAPVKRFAAEMEESVDKSLSVTERTERRSELQGEQKELLDSVLIDGQTVSYDQALNDLQDILDAAGNPERLQKLLNRNVTIGGEDVITTRSVPVEPVVPAASVVEATVPAPTGVETSTTPERGVDLGIDYAKKWAAETEIKVKESEAEAASPEYENLTKKAKETCSIG
jgi:hypothetical protein